MSHNEFLFLKGYANGAGYSQTLMVLNGAVKENEGRVRKGNGEPAYNHGVRVACHLIALGIVCEDYVIAGAVGHDIVEDSKIFNNGMDFAKKYGIATQVGQMMTALDKTGKDNLTYYRDLREDFRLILIKGADRCHNVSSMVGAFSDQKIRAYIVETELYVIPMLKYGINHYPKYSNQFYALKYHIESVLEIAKALVPEETKVMVGMTEL